MSQGREQKRVVALLDELEREYGGERGWMRKASKRMGDLDPSLFSKWREGSRNLRSDTLSRISDGLKIRPSFFTDEWPAGVARSYKDYALKPGERAVVAAAERVERRRPLPPTPEPRVERDEQTLPTAVVEALASGKLGAVTTQERAAAIAFCESPEGGANDSGDASAGALDVEDIVDFVLAFRERRLRRAAPEPPEPQPAAKQETEDARARGEAKGHRKLGPAKPQR
jgi:hypothetical protein